jgi:uncharacterized protein
MRSPICLDAFPAVPWKDGGGLTRTIAVWPEGAGFDRFIWRVSVADVQESGRFSVFPGVDRTILLLEGEGMTLLLDDGDSLDLQTPFVPRTFAGEAGIQARLTNGPVRDFNLMTRRGLSCGTVQCWTDETALDHWADEAVFFCARSSYSLLFDNDTVVLSSGEVLIVSGLPAGTRLIPADAGAVLVGALIKDRGSRQAARRVSPRKT